MLISVNEIFGPTVQGEGKSAGKPVAFLRLALCNLHCIWCDTPHTWNWEGTSYAHPEKFSKEKELHKMSASEIFAALSETKMQSLVISGGEPLLQQKQLVPLLRILKHHNWWVEVETNGTVLPRKEFVELVDQINCSPKLSNSLDPVRLRIREDSLSLLTKESKVNFKFVVAEDKDLDEILALVKRFKMQEVRLMPQCRTKDELLAKEPHLQAIAKELGFIYCTRLSILKSGTKRGV